MRFMCAVILDETLGARMTQADWDTITTESMAYDRQLIDRGIFVAAEALQGSAEAATIRVRGGDALVTDGPFAESKEVLAGFILIDVPDRQAALEVARGIPMARLGAIEVRPVMTFE